MKQMTLDDLSERELILIEKLSVLTGTVEDKHAELTKNQTYEKYKEIHRDYFDLFFLTKSEKIKLEALKRLVFLNWFSMVEPSFFTGLTNLDELIILESYSVLDTYITAHKMDKELRNMLIYYSMFEWVILAFSEGKLGELTRFVKAAALKNHPRAKVAPEEMQNRGQMGIYFSGISYWNE